MPRPIPSAGETGRGAACFLPSAAGRGLLVGDDGAQVQEQGLTRLAVHGHARHLLIAADGVLRRSVHVAVDGARSQIELRQELLDLRDHGAVVRRHGGGRRDATGIGRGRRGRVRARRRPRGCSGGFPCGAGRGRGRRGGGRRFRRRARAAGCRGRGRGGGGRGGGARRRRGGRGRGGRRGGRRGG